MTWRMGMAALLTAVLLAGPAAAREAGEAMAVIIGNKSYKPGVPAVDFAHSDADAMNKWVVEVLGYRAEDVIDLRDATKTELETWFGHQTNPRGKLAKWLRQGGEVVVYYSGHGIPGPQDHRAYLLPSDADPDTAEINGYPLEVLVANLAQLQARSVTVFLDACFSGQTAAGSPLARDTRAFGLKPNPTKVMGNVTVLSAASGSQAASSDKDAGHGLFTEYLLRAVYGEADKSRWGNGDGKVTLDEVKKYLDEEMTYRASRVLSREQTADLAGDAGRVVVAWAPGKAPVRPGGGQRVDFPPGKVFRDCADCPEMVVVPAGSFTMGSPATEPGRSDAEGPQHRVTIAKPFAVGKYEVTQAEWQAVMGNSPSRFKGDRHPVEQVSWDDAQEFIRRLNAKVRSATRVSTGGDGPYRLLTEAEWEYVARAGTATPFSTGQTITTDQANFEGNGTYNGSAKGTYRQQTVSVGSFQANAFGLHDMHGNVWEWVEDCWHDNYTGAPENGSAWTTGECKYRVLRGGSWVDDPRHLRSARRSLYEPVIRNYDAFGFRLARTF